MADACQKKDVMTRIILAFPLNRTAAALSCVWFTTGNPAHPLACKWVARDELDAGS
jgi:hypothetical protein